VQVQQVATVVDAAGGRTIDLLEPDGLSADLASGGSDPTGAASIDRLAATAPSCVRLRRPEAAS
jgi:hypothetical protein